MEDHIVKIQGLETDGSLDYAIRTESAALAAARAKMKELVRGLAKRDHHITFIDDDICAYLRGMDATARKRKADETTDASAQAKDGRPPMIPIVPPPPPASEPADLRYEAVVGLNVDCYGAEMENVGEAKVVVRIEKIRGPSPG